jgi:hypothetical protein
LTQARLQREREEDARIAAMKMEKAQHSSRARITQEQEKVTEEVAKVLDQLGRAISRCAIRRPSSRDGCDHVGGTGADRCTHARREHPSPGLPRR